MITTLMSNIMDRPFQKTHLPETSVTFWISHSFMCQGFKKIISSVSFPCPGNFADKPISLFPRQGKHLFTRNISIYFQTHSELVPSNTGVCSIIPYLTLHLLANCWDVTWSPLEPLLWEVSRRKKKSALFFGTKYIPLLVESLKSD